MFSALITSLIGTTNLIFIGHLNQPAILAGVGMGNTLVNLCGLSILLGFNSALDTLISQAAGAGNKELCGVYLNRGRFILIMLYIPLFILLSHLK
jgi:MATE family multidrug resistance protein